MKTKMSVLSLVLMLAVPVAYGDVAEVYAKNCASCHGKDGSGNTTMGKKSKVKDYTKAEEQAAFTDADAKKVILEGKGKMKGYKDKISDADADALVKHIRSFKK